MNKKNLLQPFSFLIPLAVVTLTASASSALTLNGSFKSIQGHEVNWTFTDSEFKSTFTVFAGKMSGDDESFSFLNILDVDTPRPKGTGILHSQTRLADAGLLQQQ